MCTFPGMDKRRSPLDVGVVGSGTAGSAAALFLAAAGHRVTLYERVPDPQPVGAGIVLQPTGLAVLGRLGLAEHALRKGARIARLRCETAGGRPVVDLRYEALTPGLHGLGLHRGALFETLFGAALRAPGVTVRCGVSVEALRHGGVGRVDLEGPGRAPLGRHQLVVVADGARSHVRDTTSSVARATPYAWGALWFIGRDPDGRFGGRLYQVVDGPRRMLGLLPTGLGPGAAREGPLVSLFWSLRCDTVDAWRARGLAPWKAEVMKYAPEAASVLDQITDPAQVLFASYMDVVMDDWHAGPVVYLGDAAHATSPQLGQGCNLALWDAMVLSDCISDVPSVPAALAEYTRRRREHLGYYQFATRWLTPFFQSDAVPLGWLRDALMGPACRVPLFQREMVRSMAGVKTGFLYGSLPLDRGPARHDA